MKVGIMSMQRVVNYGSFLQAYSLKKNIEAMGADVEFVDYQIEKPLVYGDDKKQSKLMELISKIYEKVVSPVKLSHEQMQPYWDGYERVDREYYEKMLPMLGMTKEKNYRPELDLLVIGSDEVFNCLQPNPNVGYSRELFGANQNAAKIITYAASFGNTTEEGLRKYEIYDEIREYISHFSGISARDKNSLKILSGMTEKVIIKNVDPVFLYDYEKEVNVIDVPINDYLVVYAYAKRISKKEAAAIIKFAKKHNKQIVCLCAPQEYLTGYLALNPFEVLAYIKNADYVVTDTFHGTVFSIKYNKAFATFVRGGYEASYGNNEKLCDLLETFWLEKRSVGNVKDLEQILLSKYDFEQVNQIISSEKKKAVEYLNRFVEE